MIRRTSVTIAISTLFASATIPALAIDLQAQGSGRGGPFRVSCPAGSFMTGFEGRTGAWIDNLRIVCASFDGSTRKFVNPRPAGGRIGVSGGGGPSSAQCPADWAIARIKYQETKGDGPTNVGHSIAFTCAIANGPDLVARHFGPLTTPENRPRGSGPFGTELVETACPAFEFATGLHGRAGIFIDAVGLTCGPLPAAQPAVATQPAPGPAPAPAATSSLHAGPATCKSGFVWRLAVPNDLVCVVPAARDRAAVENATNASRVDPRGPYGPNSCKSGFVWREAFAGDTVCVTPQVRTLVRQENQQNASNRVDPGSAAAEPKKLRPLGKRRTAE